MLKFVYNGVTYDKIPDPLPIPGGQISPVKESDFILILNTPSTPITSKNSLSLPIVTITS